MSMENLGPYTNFHELNQDWFLQEFNKLLAQWKAMQKNFDSLQDAFNDLKSYVQDYFKNLDVQDEINNKLDEMYNNGLFEVLLNKFVSFTTPEIFGAKGDGTTDDTDAFKKCIDYCAVNNVILLIPSKTYMVTDLLLRHGLHIIGEKPLSSIIHIIGGEAHGDSEDNYLFNGCIDGITLIGDNSTPKQNGFHLSQINGYVHNCYAKRFKGSGFKIIPYTKNYQEIVNAGENHSLCNCNANNCGTGFELTAYDSFYNNLVAGRCDRGASISACKIDGLHVWGYSSIGLDLYGSVFGNNIEVEASLTATPTGGIILHNDNITLNNLYIWNNNVKNSYIWCDNCNNLTITNLLVGAAGTLNDAYADPTSIQLIGGTVTNIVMTGVINDSFTKGNLNKLTVKGKSYFNILSNNLDVSFNDIDQLRNKCDAYNMDFTVTTGNISGSATSKYTFFKNETAFVYGAIIGSENKRYFFYGCVNNLNLSINTNNSDIIFTMNEGKINITVNKGGIYSVSAKKLTPIFI